MPQRLVYRGPERGLLVHETPVGRVSGRLAGKVAIVVGAGQTPGDTIGNGRATAVLFAREGAKVVAVDRDLASAEETAGMIREEGDPYRSPPSRPRACWWASRSCFWRGKRSCVGSSGRPRERTPR